MLGTQKKELVESEMKELTAPYQNDKLEFIKNPVVAEFLGFSQNTDFTESDLEKSILSNLQKFLMELGKGYAFVARQQHIHTEKQDYYIDLVFYNYILKCFVVIDLITEKITHQDVGQMDMYIRMYDELKRSEGDNPTIGIVLCSDTDDDIARARLVIESRLKTYLGKKRKESSEASLEAMQEEGIDFAKEKEENSSLHEEIIQYREELLLFGLTLEVLADRAPKHSGTRKRAVTVAEIASEDKETVEETYLKKKLPTAIFSCGLYYC